MHIADSLENKHRLHTRAIPLLTLVAVLLMPQQALAFELTPRLSYPERFLAPIAYAAEDSLAEAPSNHPFSTQAIAAPSSPITEEAKWAKPKPPVRLAYVPDPAFIPGDGAPVVMEGEASYYSRAGCLGCDPNVIMANGQPLNDDALTMAIGADKKHLVGHTARVTSLATGQSVMVKITDTGGFYQARYGYRVADLTIATKTAIGMKGGVGQVRVEVY